ncbi:MAG: hypothetical protein NUV77_12930 [Thermoguttaceae bacterium]|jgi:hypothetical protein|nr:hypothetical protein [Thermoguttaceae bacterium]
MRSVAYRLAFLGAIALVFFIASGAESATTTLDAQTIKAGLRTTTVEEHGFVDRVVGLAEKGVLPPQLVESTFQWARKKPYFRFQYFKRGLILRAAKLGISL